ncbi:MAG TPA: hypothetical protein VJ204_19420, partial [Solirubrobacterales bacterium]|nr:hypothetical protein [Solirubrobacterales bacterium]
MLVLVAATVVVPVPVLPTASIVAALAASAVGSIVGAGVVSHVSSLRATSRSQFSVMVTANCERTLGGDGGAGGVDGDGVGPLGCAMAGAAVVDRHAGAERA